MFSVSLARTPADTIGCRTFFSRVCYSRSAITYLKADPEWQGPQARHCLYEIRVVGSLARRFDSRWKQHME